MGLRHREVTDLHLRNIDWPGDLLYLNSHKTDRRARGRRRRLADSGENRALYDLSRAVEATALRLLEEAKPGRRLQTNVEFYTALLLHCLGLETELFTPTFALGRVVGWCAHAFEQLDEGRLIRPRSRYVGPTGRAWV